MTAMARSLLCELHAHSTWSDGDLSVRELVDLYGRAGFDVLAVTDHARGGAQAHLDVRAGNFAAYLADVEAEAERAVSRYGLLVVPGLELTDDHEDPGRAAHALALGIREFVGLEGGLDAALVRAREAGALLVGAHPYPLEQARRVSRGTGRFAREPEWAAAALHRLELANRHDLFPWVAERRLPVLACGDFHELDHLYTWKTLVPCAKTEEAVLDYLRSARPVDLTRIDELPGAGGLAA
jgi:predicted metal-dependent phosphoesterase TrpH